jgi:conjugal transfer pilus assembly protein TraK
VRIHSLLALVLLGLSLEGHALQLVDVVDGQTVTVKVSSKDLTRIAMADGGRIDRVWGLEDYMQVEPDREGGQVFLRPAPGMTARAFSFFVRDDKGATHTLLAVPVDMPSDTVLLRPKNRAAEVSNVVTLAIPYTERIKNLVRALARGAVPEGYMPSVEEREIPLWAEARIALTARYSGELMGEVYQLTNISDAEMRLDEREFARLATDIKAVAIVEHRLAPQQSTRLYLVREGR